MTNYEELVKALRCCSKHERRCLECEFLHNGYCSLQLDAAAAIEAIDRLLDQNTQRCEALRKQLREAHESYERHLNELEAQVPKRGEWKPFDLTYGRSIYSCSVCEQATEVPVCMEKPMYAYCPNCGAKMEVQE